MARISVYSLDNNITALDKILGTDFNGSVTKNFVLSEVANLFNTGLVTVGGQVSYKFVNTISQKSFSGPGDNQTLSSVTNIKLSSVDGAGHNISDFIQEYNLKRIILFKNTNKNIYGIFDVTSLAEDIDNPGYYNLALIFISGNGNLELEEYYSISLFAGKDKDKHYKHTQSSPSATWTIQHNLNKLPSVTTVNNNNIEVKGQIQYIDTNNLTITFSAGFSGKAYLN